MQTQLLKLRRIYNEYPRAFWVYNIVVFSDRFGGFMLYPFFALYLTQKFQIGMTTVGGIFALFSLSGFVGSALGGALTDRMGRKAVILFSLVMSAISALGMGLAPSLGVRPGSVSPGFSIGHPAQSRRGDLVPEEKRVELRDHPSSSPRSSYACYSRSAHRKSYLLIFIVDASSV
jgi:MFS family permease